MDNILLLQKKIKRTKRAASVVTVLTAMYCLVLIVLPYIPAGVYFVKQFLSPTEEYALAGTIVIPSNVLLYKNEGKAMLVIPAIGVDKPIIEADTIKEVHENIWRRPQGSFPDMESNTVLVAHRYATIGGNRASTFYNLPKLVVGDRIYVTWEGSVYVYEVQETMTVEPTAIEVEEPTDETMLTLYTCTPLWTATHRFVVRAPLLEII